jgi:hypothetical protein
MKKWLDQIVIFVGPDDHKASEQIKAPKPIHDDSFWNLTAGAASRILDFMEPRTARQRRRFVYSISLGGGRTKWRDELTTQENRA